MLTNEVHAVAPVERRVRPHEREAAFERVRVAAFAVGVAQAAAPQNKKPRDPLLEKMILRREAVQGQVKAQQRGVPRPRWLTHAAVQMRG